MDHHRDITIFDSRSVIMSRGTGRGMSLLLRILKEEMAKAGEGGMEEERVVVAAWKAT